nr:hypothetical protein [Tanacetum cinerariifolium]
MAIDGVGWDWSYMANEEDHALVAVGETPTEFALMANNENKLVPQQNVKTMILLLLRRHHQQIYLNHSSSLLSLRTVNMKAR